MRLIRMCVIGAVLLLGAACSNIPERENAAMRSSEKSVSVNAAKGVHTSLDQSGSVDSGEDVTLTWERYTNSDTVRLLEEGLSQADRIVKETSLYAMNGLLEQKVVIYARKNDPDYLYAALVQEGRTYDLGVIAGSVYDQDDQLTVRNIWLFDREVVKIQGFVGATASISRYFGMVDKDPEPLLTVTDGHALELDADHDGKQEVVSSSGTIPRTMVYRWRDGQIERSILNDALQAEAVTFTDEGAVLAAFGQDQSRLQLYWLRSDHLKPFLSLSREAYESVRVTIPYSKEEILNVREQADKLRIFDPYVPQKGLADDYGVEVKREENGALKLTFPHFAIYESRTSLRPLDLEGGIYEKRSFPDFTAEWIGLPESESGGSWYFSRGSTFFSIGSAKSVSRDELLYVAASLTPLDELQLSDGTVPAADPPLQITSDYLFALQAVNEFASAWSHRNPVEGMKWVSDEWKEGKNTEQMDAYFYGTSNPHHMTFELAGKRRVDDRTYLFDLRLYEYYTGQPDWVHGFPIELSRGWTIETVKVGENERGEGIWKVNP